MRSKAAQPHTYSPVLFSKHFSSPSCYGIERGWTQVEMPHRSLQSSGLILILGSSTSAPLLKQLYFFFKFIFNRRIIALQSCVGFCHISRWISHRHTYIPSLLNLLPASYPPSHPSRLSQSTSFELPASYSTFPLAICFTYGNVYVLMLLSYIAFPNSSWSCYHQNNFYVTRARG